MPDPKLYDENVEFKLKELSDWLQAQLPEDWHHTLLLHHIGEDGMVYYMTDINRTDLIKQLRILATMLEKQEHEEHPRQIGPGV